MAADTQSFGKFLHGVAPLGDMTYCVTFKIVAEIGVAPGRPPCLKISQEGVYKSRGTSAYAYGIAKNHPFFDGNKRTALVVCELFLALNGYDLIAGDEECLAMFLSLADGSQSEQALTEWLLDNTHFANE